MLATILGIAVLAFIGLWVLGGVVTRVVGLALITLGAVGLVVIGDLAAGLLTFTIGLVLWLLGQWHYALRHHEYASPLARRLFTQLLPARLDPTRGWGVPVHPAERGPGQHPR